MSSKPVQSITPERVASRRNVIRAAAWTAPAVSVAVAAPAFANHSSTKASVAGTIARSANGGTLTFAIDLTNSGSVQFGSPSVVITGAGISPSVTSTAATLTSGSKTRLPLAANSTVNCSNATNIGTLTLQYYADASHAVLLGTITVSSIAKGGTVQAAGYWVPAH
ncbi:hypothetical protein ACS3YM_15020 [Nocardia sp. N13]|uniref:hypothetical protein n=1 Tax=Nocardioides sp. N13(2025) TaxID=3453405 RepID=UPI003F76A141